VREFRAAAYQSEMLTNFLKINLQALESTNEIHQLTAICIQQEMVLGKNMPVRIARIRSREMF
jgi:hypothetical protein